MVTNKRLLQGSQEDIRHLKARLSVIKQRQYYSIGRVEMAIDLLKQLEEHLSYIDESDLDSTL